MSGRRLIIWLFALSVVLLIIFLPGFIRYQELQSRNKKLEAEIARLKEENIKLLDEQYKLQHDPVYVEKVARERLGVIKEGEVIYKVKPREKKNAKERAR